MGKLLCPTLRRACIDLTRSQMRVSERRFCCVPGQYRTKQRWLPHVRAEEDRLIADLIELIRQFG